MKYTVIHIMNHSPAYEEYANKPRPQWHWNTTGGQWVGIWGYDWDDQIAIEASKVTAKFSHEIWQPDLRADKIYFEEIYPGVVHRLFPAKKTKKWHGIKMAEVMQSLDMIKALKSLPRNSILHLGHPVYAGIYDEVVRNFDGGIISTYHGIINLPVDYLLRFQKDPLKKISYLVQHFHAKRDFKKISHVTYMNNTNLKSLNKYYSGPLTKLTMGIDTKKFCKLDKNLSRGRLMLPLNKKVLLTVSRLYEHKRVDKIIEILNKIDQDFVFIIVGHGTSQYESYLHEKALPLINENKIRFERYTRGEELIDYLNAADLFILASRNEGSSVAVMEAMACEVPIFCTDTGNTAEVLKENNSGIIVGINNYKEWETKLKDYLNGKPVKSLDLNVVKEHYDWGSVARKFVEIYDQVKSDFYE
ncbi:MAG: glycosyltransferase family 4 protein [Bacteroidales bacterium]